MIKQRVRIYLAVAIGCCLILGSLLFFLTLDPYRSLWKSKAANLAEKIISWNKHKEKFFVDQNIFFKGESLAFVSKGIISADESVVLNLFGKGKVDITVEFYNKFGTIHSTENFIFFADQKVPPYFSTLSGFSGKGEEIKIDSKVSNGWIDIEINPSNGEKVNIPVFVETREVSDVLFVESTDTLNAYVSAYGLPTKYFREPAPLGAYTRPHAMPQNYDILNFATTGIVHCKDHLINADFVLKSFIRELNCSYNCVSDHFLDKYSNFASAKVLIFGAHNEYWTRKKAENVRKFIQNGGSVLFLGGNTAWRAVERAESFDMIHGDNLLDDGFEDLIHEVLGSYYDINGYNTFAPFHLNKKASGHEILSNINSPTGLFALGTDFPCCGKEINGGSGLETDKLLSGSDESFVLLASGDNGWGGGADIVYRVFPNGGSVLNFGSVALWHKTKDEVVRNLVSNFLDDSLR
jgi:hypothetical protein